MDAGKHVVCEKPLATTAGDAKALAAFAAERDGVFAVNYQYRYYPMVQQARAMIRDGVLGRLYLLHRHYLQDWLLYPTDYHWSVAVDHGGASRAVVGQQHANEQIWVARRDRPSSVLHKMLGQLGPGGPRFALCPAGHPEGYGDAMGNRLRLVYERVSEFRQGKKAAAEPESPTFAEGARMVAIVEAVLTSARRGGEWVAIA